MNKYLVIGLCLILGNSYIHPLSAEASKAEKKISYYTCSMHPQIHKDHPGSCPICGMTLVPVYQEETSSTPSTSSIMIAPEKQQTIGLKTVAVEKKELIHEIRANARVAFDPELSTAQKEYVAITNNIPSLKNAARQRLKLLGMSEEEIRYLEKHKNTSQDLVLPQNNYWVYATLYPQDLPLIKKGENVVIQQKDEIVGHGTVQSIDPILEAETQSARARILVTSDLPLRPNTFLTATFQVVIPPSFIVPTTALVETGTRKIVFVMRDHHVEKREVKVNLISQDQASILEGVEEGEMVVSSGTFLIDSESQLKGNL